MTTGACLSSGHMCTLYRASVCALDSKKVTCEAHRLAGYRYALLTAPCAIPLRFYWRDRRPTRRASLFSSGIATHGYRTTLGGLRNPARDWKQSRSPLWRGSLAAACYEGGSFARTLLPCPLHPLVIFWWS